MDFEQTIRQVQDTLTVMVGIQARQAEVLKGHGEWIEQHETRVAASKRNFQRIESNLAEATEKLNALIAVVDGAVKRNGGTQK